MVKQQERVSAVFAALADPTRRRIVHRLSRHGESRVTTLAKPFGVSLPAISRHLRVLEKARLIERQRHGREHLIRSRAAGLEDARKWIAQCAAGWESGFDRLDELLKAAQLPVGKTSLDDAPHNKATHHKTSHHKAGPGKKEKRR